MSRASPTASRSHARPFPLLLTGFNVNYLVAVLRYMTTDEAKITFKASERAAARRRYRLDAAVRCRQGWLDCGPPASRPRTPTPESPPHPRATTRRSRAAGRDHQGRDQAPRHEVSHGPSFAASSLAFAGQRSTIREVWDRSLRRAFLFGVVTPSPSHAARIPSGRPRSLISASLSLRAWLQAPRYSKPGQEQTTSPPPATVRS